MVLQVAGVGVVGLISGFAFAVLSRAFNDAAALLFAFNRWRHNQQLNRICYICKCNDLFCWLDMKLRCFHKNHLYFEAHQKTHKKTHIRWHFLCERKTPRHFFDTFTKRRLILLQCFHVYRNLPRHFSDIRPEEANLRGHYSNTFPNTPGNAPRHYFWYF